MEETKDAAPRVVLASASPRRRALLEQAGVAFEVVLSDYKECAAENEPPRRLARRLSAEKCRAARALVNGAAVIIAADTVVALGRQVFGKPADAADALRMLEALRGKKHAVFTGVTIIDTRREQQANLPICFVERAEVVMRSFSDKELHAYVATGEPFGKAGAYAIQGKGALLVERVRGDYNAVVGLPLARVCLALRSLGVDVTEGWRSAGEADCRSSR